MFPILPVNVPRSNLPKNPGEKHSMLFTHKLVILKINKAYVVMRHNSKGNENLKNPKSGLKNVSYTNVSLLDWFLTICWIVGRLIVTFSFSWIIHGLFRLAPSKLYDGKSHKSQHSLCMHLHVLPKACFDNKIFFSFI